MLRHFLSLLDLSAEELTALLDEADRLRQAWRARTLPRLLERRAVALWFEGTGFRNRAAFELGVAALGGQAVHLPGIPGQGEPLEDVAAYLGNWFSAVVIRMWDHGGLARFAASSPVPVVNARTSHNHPCEVLGDLQFIRTVRGSLDGLRVAFVGEASNLCHSWFEAAARLPMRLVQACPEGYAMPGEWLARYRDSARGKVSTTADLEGALRQADLVYTDCWPGATEEGERERIRQLFAPYQVTAERLRLCAPGALFLPCPPVHRGEEVDDSAMLSPLCRVYEAKEYLLHAQNAVLALLTRDA